MFYKLHIFDSEDDYQRALSGDNTISGISLSLDDEDAEEVISFMKTAMKAGKVVAICTSETPF